MKGTLTITTNGIKRSYPNTIQRVGLLRLAEVLAGDHSSNRTLSQIELGANNNTNNNEFRSLVRPMGIKFPLTVTTSDAYPVTVTCLREVASGDIVRPYRIREVGIFFSDNTLFARVTLPGDGLLLDTGQSNTFEYRAKML